MTAALTISIPSSSPFTTAAGNKYYSAKTMMIHRDQDQIRAQFLNSLGIVKRTAGSSSTVVTTSTTTTTTANDNDDDDDHRDEISSSSTHDGTTTTDNNHGDDDINTKKEKTVTFPDNDKELVAIREIPSFRDYDVETRLRLWNSMKAVTEIVKRNTMEFRSENWDWKQVLEEDDFIRLPPASGNDSNDSYDRLIHPTTYSQQQQERELAEQRRRRRKKQKQYSYKSISACLDFTGTTSLPPRSPSPRSRRRKQRLSPTTNN